MFWKKKDVKKQEQAQKYSKAQNDAVNQPARAYYRIEKLFKTLWDINPNIGEIELLKHVQYEFGSSNILSIQTGFGKRFIELMCYYRGSDIIKFYEKDPTPIYGIYNPQKPLFEISFRCSFSSYCVDIKPSLTSESIITEHQIYLCLKEIENIISKYHFQTVSAEHKNNMENFIGRF